MERNRVSGIKNPQEIKAQVGITGVAKSAASEGSQKLFSVLSQSLNLDKEIIRFTLRSYIFLILHIQTSRILYNPLCR